jgi:Concanavalin A-like lectin/glucanases superfamily
MKRIALIIALLLTLPAHAGRSLNGTTDTISVPGVGNAIDITGQQLSFSCWFMLTAAPAAETLPCAKWASTNAGGFMFNYNQSGFANQVGGHIYISISENHFQDLFCSNTINLNQWYSMVLTYQNNVNMKLWLGTGGVVTLCGTDSSVGTVGTVVSSGGPLTFGSSNAGRAGSVFTQGKVGEAAVWGVRISDNVAAAIAGGVCVKGASARRMSVPPPAGYWPLWGASGSSIEPDLSGNAINGTLTGTTQGAHPPCTQ